MFTKNIFTQKDSIADLVKPMLEAQTKTKMEELKGNQAVLDKNKNNKLDADDFKILRGEKKAVKEENVEESSPFDWKKPREPEVKGGAGIKKGRAYGGAAQKSKPEQDDADDKKKQLKEAEGKITHIIAKKDLNKHRDWMDSEGFDTNTKSLPKTHPNHKTHVGIVSHDSMEHSYHSDGYADPIKEEVEQIDELKKSTLGSYVKKAAKSQADHSFDHGEDEHRQYGDPEDTEREKEMKDRERAITNREKGIGRAVKRLAKEEVESKEKEDKDDVPFDGPYKKKDSAKAGKHGAGYSTARHLAQMGMKKALKKEEVEQVDELNRSTVKSYIDK